MKINTAIVLFLSLIAVSCSHISKGGKETTLTTLTSQAALDGIEKRKGDYILVWNDEFNGAELDARFWTGTPATAKGHQGGVISRTMDQKNVRVASGNLVIEGHKETGANNYSTGARINTKNMMQFQYGLIEIRAKLPKGKGVWPAFWLLSPAGLGLGRPEIDIFEMLRKDNTVAFNVHKWWRNTAGALLKHESLDGKGYNKTFTLPEGVFNDSYHVFGLEWTKEKFSFLVDDVERFSYPITGETNQMFHQELYVILSMLVGSQETVAPDQTTEFPATYLIDWIRLYQKPGYGTLKLFLP